MSTKVKDLSIFDELKTMLNTSNLSDKQFFYELFYGYYDELGYPEVDGSWKEKSDIQNLLFTKAEKELGYKHLESEGGNEGGGEYCYGIISYKDKFYKAEWSYYSYNGCEYDYIADTIREVVPVEKIITVYQ